MHYITFLSAAAISLRGQASLRPASVGTVEPTISGVAKADEKRTAAVVTGHNAVGPEKGALHASPSVGVASASGGPTPNMELSSPQNTVPLPVKILHDIPADAMALQSWTFLKESLPHIGVSAASILQVEDDLRHMQADLHTQEFLWHQGKAQLLKVKQDLLRDVGNLTDAIRKRNGVKVASVDWKERANAAESRLQQWRKENFVEVSHGQLQEKRLRSKVHELGEQLTKAQKDQMTDAVEFQTQETALRKEIADFGAKKDVLLLDIQKNTAAVAADNLRFKDQVSVVNSTTSELELRIQELQNVLDEGSKMPDRITQQKRLKNATETLIVEQTAHQEEKIRCDARLATVSDVVTSEDWKIKRRRQEVESFCQPVVAQHDVLKGLLRDCK